MELMMAISCLQVKALLLEGKDVRLGDWKAADIEILNSFQLLTAKPVVYLVTFSSSRKSVWLWSAKVLIVYYVCMGLQCLIETISDQIQYLVLY